MEEEGIPLSFALLLYILCDNQNRRKDSVKKPHKNPVYILKVYSVLRIRLPTTQLETFLQPQMNLFIRKRASKLFKILSLERK
jgi:hypothetical protein